MTEKISKQDKCRMYKVPLLTKGIDIRGANHLTNQSNHSDQFDQTLNGSRWLNLGERGQRSSC